MFAENNIPKGTVILKNMLAIKRPGTGIGPKFLQKIIGAKALKNIKEDEVIKYGMLKLSKR